MALRSVIQVFSLISLFSYALYASDSCQLSFDENPNLTESVQTQIHNLARLKLVIDQKKTNSPGDIVNKRLEKDFNNKFNELLKISSRSGLGEEALKNSIRVAIQKMQSTHLTFKASPEEQHAPKTVKIFGPRKDFTQRAPHLYHPKIVRSPAKPHYFIGTGDRYNVIEIVDPQQWEVVHKIEHHNSIKQIVMNPAKSEMYSLDHQGSILVSDTHTWKSVKTMGFPYPVSKISVSPNGKFISLLVGNQGVKVYELNSWIEVAHIRYPKFFVPQAAEAVHFSGDGKYVMTSFGRALTLTETSTWKTVKEVTFFKKFVDISSTADGRFLIFLDDTLSGKENKITISDITALDRIDIPAHEINHLYNIRKWYQSESGRYFVTVSHDQVIVTEVGNWRKILTSRSNFDIVDAVLSKDEQFIIKLNKFGTIDVVEIVTGNLISSIPCSGRAVGLSLTGDGTQLMVSIEDAPAQILDLFTEVQI